MDRPIRRLPVKISTAPSVAECKLEEDELDKFLKNLDKSLSSKNEFPDFELSKLSDAKPFEIEPPTENGKAEVNQHAIQKPEIEPQTN